MFIPDLAETLAVYDGFDGSCANQWLANRKPDPGRYTKLAMRLADDRIWIDTRGATCVDRFNCAGRPPGADAVDTFRSLLVTGDTRGVEDGVSGDDRAHSDRDFPFLAPPGP
jgi:hypothetical protein